MKNQSILLITFILIGLNLTAQSNYKMMMEDKSINFYDVCKAADKYFETHDKTVKGSGWKGYQRWKNANEYKYYPTGNREHVNPYFVEDAYKKFLESNKSQTKAMYNNGWHELGPYRLDSLTGHYSAGLGRVEDFYVDPNNNNIIYVGSRSGGFWRSIDGGANWQGSTTDYLIASGVNAISASPTNSDSVLINLRNSRNGYSHGVYRSVNGGVNWVESNFNPTNVGFGGLGNDFVIYELKYHPRIPNLIFIGTNKGVYRSDDNLATWSRLLNNSDISQIEFHPTNNNIVYLYDNYYWGSNKNYVFRSVDQGLSYSLSNEILGNNDNRSVALSVSTDCDNCLYFGSDNGVWLSTDNGINFSFLSNPNQGCGGFSVNDVDTTKMIYGYVDIEISNDGGSTFNQATYWSLGNTDGAGSGNQNSFNTSTNYVHADLHPAKCINGIFYVGTDGLFSKSTDNGVTWTNLSQGIGIRENYKLGVSQSNHYRSISGSQDNGTSIKHRDSWIEFYGADGMEGLIHPLNDDWMIGSLQSGGRRRTKDGGQSQSGITPAGSNSGQWEAPIAYDPNNHMIIYDFRDEIYKSEDFGSSYTSIGTPSSFTGTIKQAEIAQNNSNIMIVVQNELIDKSTDGGVTFTSIKNNLPDHSIEDVAFDPNNDDVIIVVNGRYQNNGEKIYMTTNGGTTWTNITYNLGDLPIRTVVIDHTNASNIYVGTELGVYTKSMSGTNWNLYNPNLPNCTVEELEIVNGSNTIKAATWGRGMWEYTLVGRNDFPSIMTTKITDMPDGLVPLENSNQFVTSTVHYDNTLSSVYVEWSANTPIFGNIIPMTNLSDSTWVSDSALPSYANGTKMYFKVFAVGNNNDTTETYKFMYTTREVVICQSSGNMSYATSMTEVSFNDIFNQTGKTQPYTDYRMTDSTIVYIDSTYDLSVNLNSDGNYKIYSKVWIDWNQDLDFDDAGEEYDLGSAQNVIDGITTNSPLSVTIPNGVVLGETIMRVSCQYNTPPTACNQNFDGEVEDYKIIVRDYDLDLGLNPTEVNDMIIYPNPTTGLINIKLNNTNNEIVTVTVKNVLGQIVINQTFKSTDLININLEGANGVYFVTVELNNSETVNFKVLKSE